MKKPILMFNQVVVATLAIIGSVAQYLRHLLIIQAILILQLVPTAFT